MKIGCLGMIGAAIAATLAAYFILFPNYTYRYRLTISIETDGQIHSGSSVFEVTWVGQPDLPDVGAFHPRLRGQATFIDLGSRGAVVATLNNGESYGPAADGAINAIWLAGNAFGNRSTNDELPKLPHLIGRRELASDNMPRLIWFRDLADPRSAEKLHVSEIPARLGSNARLVAAYVEITYDPIIIDIDQKVRWLRELAARGPSSVVHVSYGFDLGTHMFIAR